MTVTPAGSTRDSSFPYSIQPGGIFVFQTDGASSTAVSGWVKLTPDTNTNSPAGAGLFSFSQGGILVTESGVATAMPTWHARVYLDQSGNHRTGLAIAKPGSETLDLRLTAYQLDGSTVAGNGPVSFSVGGNGHTAQFADQLIKGLPPNFTGVLDISSPQPFVALTMRSLTNTRDNFLLTTFPIADFSQKAPSPVVFPQIADGGGYVTQFVLLSANGASGTTLNFFGEDGKPLYVGKY